MKLILKTTMETSFIITAATRFIWKTFYRLGFWLSAMRER